MRRRSGLTSTALVAALAVACSPSPPPRPAPASPLRTTCAAQLPARTAATTATDAGVETLPPLPGPASKSPGASSLLVVNLDLPLAAVQAAIEPRVPRRLAQERDHDLGVAGRLEYVVDRGAFTLHVEGDTLVVETPLTAHAQACAKAHCYASCTPEARATVRVPLRLDADYKLHTSDVHVDVTRGCEIRALGGLVSVDVTPFLRGALASQSRVVAAEVDRQLPDLHGEATKLWSALQPPSALPLGACVVLDADEIVQGAASGTADVAHLRFGLVAHPELRVKCGAASTASPRPLPPLRHDPTLPELGDVHLAIALSREAPARALEGGDPIELGNGRARVGTARGDANRLDLVLAGEVCGEVAVRAAGLAWSAHDNVHLAGVTVLDDDLPRLTAARVDAELLAQAVTHTEIPVPFSADALQELVPGLASAYHDDRVTLAANVASARQETAVLRDGEPIAIVLLRGAVTLTAR